MKDEKLYLIHMAECIQRIEEYTAEGRRAFFNDRKTQDAVLRNLQTLAESSQRIPPAWKTSRPEVDWAGLSAFRNVVVHDYLGIDLEEIWEIVEKDLPALKSKVEELARELGISLKPPLS